MEATKPIGDLIDLNNFDRSKKMGSKVYASVAEMKRSKVSSQYIIYAIYIHNI